MIFPPNQNAINVKLRQLNWLHCQQTLSRRDCKNTVHAVLEAVKIWIDGPSTNTGYHSIYQKLITNGIKTDSKTVRLYLKIIDPKGVESENVYKLKRRTNASQGPNFL